MLIQTLFQAAAFEQNSLAAVTIVVDVTRRFLS